MEVAQGKIPVPVDMQNTFLSEISSAVWGIKIIPQNQRDPFSAPPQGSPGNGPDVMTSPRALGGRDATII